jgi:hypothetical protein
MLTRHIIQERTQIIPIKQKFIVPANNLTPKGEYSLKQNFFDPSKSSPPNDFMIKLHMRMSMYNDKSYMSNDDSLVKE